MKRITLTHQQLKHIEYPIKNILDMLADNIEEYVKRDKHNWDDEYMKDLDDEFQAFKELYEQIKKKL